MPKKATESGAELDRYDRAILRIIQRDNKTPQRVIAEEVNLSAAAVQRRIAAMEAAGVIARNVAVVEPVALSMTITAIVEVYLVDERARTVDRAKALFREAPEVQQCFYVTGGTSFVLIVIAPDMPAYEALTRRLFEESGLVTRYRTLVALDRVKTDTAIVIPPGPREQ
jgi:Lrp/AsnC family leucine-responsive transcriptional regulator